MGVVVSISHPKFLVVKFTCEEEKRHCTPLREELEHMNKGRTLKGTRPWYKDGPEKLCPPPLGDTEVGVSVMTLDGQNKIKK